MKKFSSVFSCFHTDIMNKYIFPVPQKISGNFPEHFLQIFRNIFFRKSYITSLHPTVSVCPSLPLYVCVSASVSVCLCVCVPVCLCLCLSLYPPALGSVSLLSLYLSASVRLYLSVSQVKSNIVYCMED